jgi:hypothetical protein
MAKFWGEYGPYDEQPDGLPHFGQVVLDFIKRTNWSVEQFGDVYGQTVRNHAYSKMRIYQMIQENSFPTDQTRRSIIVNLLHIPAILLSTEMPGELTETEEEQEGFFDRIDEQSIDLSEYSDFLTKCSKQNRSHTAQQMVNNLTVRVQHLHAVVSYTRNPQEIHKLLCQYQILLAKIERDRQHYKAALDYLNKAAWLAKECQFLILYIVAMLQHNLTLKEQGLLLGGRKEKVYLIAAMRDIGLAMQHKESLDDTLKAGLFMADSHAQAYLHFLNGETKDIPTALNLMDKAYKLIEADQSEAGIVQYLHINKERWNLARASTLIDIHYSEEDPMKYLNKLWTPPPSGKRRYVYLNALSAQAYLQQGEFPMAVSCAMEALELAMEISSTVNITRIALVYNDLLQTTFSNDSDVLELGLLLMQALHPHLVLKGRSE